MTSVYEGLHYLKSKIKILASVTPRATEVEERVVSRNSKRLSKFFGRAPSHPVESMGGLSRV